MNIYERLNKGSLIKKSDLALEFNVDEKSIQRDIEDLRGFLEDKVISDDTILKASIEYDRQKQAYYLDKMEREWFTSEEALAISKVILESRAFENSEMNVVMDKLLWQVHEDDRKLVNEMIRDERHTYVELQHKKKLFTVLWDLSTHIHRSNVIRLKYSKQDGEVREREVKPVAIMFSEFYFYLIAYLVETEHDFPAVFRIDRIIEFKLMDKKMSIPNEREFKEGEFRKRVQFMYPGKLKRVRFEYRGVVEAVLDRLPTAKIEKSTDDGGAVISAEVYGDGIDMWLRSQGELVELLK